MLVAADAIYMRRTLDDTQLPYRTADEHLFRRSLREIRQYATETPEAADRARPRLGGLAGARSRLLNHVLASLEAVMWIAPGSRTQAIRLSDCRRSSMNWNATRLRARLA